MHIVTASDDTTARIWSSDAWDEPVVLRGHEDKVRHAQWSPDGSQIVTASDDGTARVWSVADSDKQGEEPNDPLVLRGHTGPVRFAAWSPDGKHIVTASDDGLARIWNASRSGEPIVLRGHDSVIWYAAWSPDGSQIVTASGDGTNRVWYTGWPALRARLWQIDGWLTPKQRSRYLNEDSTTARKQASEDEAYFVAVNRSRRDDLPLPEPPSREAEP